MATLLSHFKSKTVTRDKEDHYIITKGSIHFEDKAIINIYASTSKFPSVSCNY